MKKTYNSEDLYTAIRINRHHYFDGPSKRVVIQVTNEGLYDIRKPNMKLDDAMDNDKVIIKGIRPLYYGEMHKVVSAKQAYFHMIISQIKRRVM